MLMRWLIVTTTTSPSRARPVPSKPGADPAQFIHAPPCSQTITGFFALAVADGVKTFRNTQSSLTGSIFVYQAAIGNAPPGICGAELPGAFASTMPAQGLAETGGMKRRPAVLSPKRTPRKI